jgi:hypothetical protein
VYRDNLQLNDDCVALKRKLSSVEGSCLELEELKARNGELEQQLMLDAREILNLKENQAVWEKTSMELQQVTEERDRLRDKVKRMEAENSENQARMLMSAFQTPASSSSLGLHSFATSSDSRVEEQDRQISELTNETLQLREEIA